jgi:hypothetical protein
LAPDHQQSNTPPAPLVIGLSPEAGGQMHTLRHYRVRLWRSERLRYRFARLLLLVSPYAFIALAFLFIAYIFLR